MRIVIAAVGKLKDGAERELCARYIERVASGGRGIGLGPVEVREIPEGRAASMAARAADEAERLLAKTKGTDVRILLDERGKAMTSAAFATLLGNLRDRGVGEVAFILGGPDGHGDTARKAATLLLSLGPMTLPHGLARIVLVEQIYRAATILAGHPYHRE
ncbi:MAG: 23S rRNA (pseudouridine(1915)-N(3))-methyltransferase RlmH [Hyphomicrobium sp.]